MAGLPDEFVIPGGSARAFKISRGQKLRIMQEEAGAVADLNAFNLNNFKERYSGSLTAALSHNLKKYKDLYSNLPYANVMFSIKDYPVEVAWTLGRCNRVVYEKRYGVHNYVGCQELLADAIKPFGLGPEQVHEAMGFFMDSTLTPDGGYIVAIAKSDRKEYAALLTEMDSLVAISACPGMLDMKSRDSWKRGGKPLRIRIT